MSNQDIASCRLYGFIDAAYIGDRDPVTLTGQLIDGGVDIIQIRAKGRTTWQIIDLGLRIVELARSRGVPVVVNDDIEAAFEIRADGVHLGQEDWAAIAPEDRRRFLSPVKILGISTHSLDQALKAERDGATYIGVGPVFATGTKPSAAPVGLDFVRQAARQVHIPWFAIGGITMERLPQVIEAGAGRVAVVSAILNAGDVTAAARQFKTVLASNPSVTS
jgi:thiamine-phosphate pyrophosphorylase